jgi:RNA polymerase sigma-70 factor, ECF subfamily
VDESTVTVNTSLAADAAPSLMVRPRPGPAIGQRYRRTDVSLAESVKGESAADPVDAAALDAELVRRAQAGDEQAFGQLIERNRRAVYRAAYAALGSADDADDVAQETFVTVYQKLHGFRGDAAFKTWLLAIAWRKALDRRRSVTRWLRMTITHDRLADEASDMIDRVPSAARSQEEGLASDELHRRVKQLIGTLPRKLRDALLLAGSGDYSYEQISRMLKVPVGTVKWRVSEARRVLKRKLAAMGYCHE